MKLLEFPPEIRDIIYSFMIPEGRTYILYCGKQEPLTDILDREEEPKFGILWTSQAIQDEFLRILCAKCTFRFTLPEITDKSTRVVRPVSQEHIDLLQHVEIVMDLYHKRDHAHAFAMLFQYANNFKQKICRISLGHELGMQFNFQDLAFFRILEYLEGFETVIVEQHFDQKLVRSIFGRPFRTSVECQLGPGREHYKESVLCSVFHPRQFHSLGHTEQITRLLAHFEQDESLTLTSPYKQTRVR